MEPIEFVGMNRKFAEHQDEYTTLPVHIDDEGIVTSCWALNLKERIILLLTGKVFLQVMSFGGNLQPQKIVVQNPVRQNNDASKY